MRYRAILLLVPFFVGNMQGALQKGKEEEVDQYPFAPLFEENDQFRT